MATPKEIESIAESIFMLSTPRSCATGVLLADDRVLTNAHVVADACHATTCSGIRLNFANRPGMTAVHEHRLKEATLELLVPSIDVAVLKVSFSSPIAARPLVLGHLPSRGSQVHAIGFPGCRALEASSGVIEESDALYYHTSALGRKGSSGSALVTDDLRLVGLVSESRHFIPGLLGELFGSEFLLTAVRSEVLEALNGDPAQSLLNEASLLNEFYKSAVLQPGNPLTRMRRGLDFTEKVEQALQRALELAPTPRNTSLIAWYGSRYFSLADYSPNPPLKDDLHALEIEKLIWAAQLEMYGLRRADFHPLDPDRVLENLEQLERSEKHRIYLRSLVEPFMTTGKTGLALITLAILACALAGFALWAFSLGTVYSAARGGVLKRIALALALGIFFWPLSVLLFHFGFRRR